MTKEDVDIFVEDFEDFLSDQKAKALREKLTPHIGQPKSNQPPEDSEVSTDSYTERDAEKWIAEYKEAMSEVPEADS